MAAHVPTSEIAGPSWGVDLIYHSLLSSACLDLRSLILREAPLSAFYLRFAFGTRCAFCLFVITHPQVAGSCAGTTTISSIHAVFWLTHRFSSSCVRIWCSVLWALVSMLL
ncbi:hypothetical protein A0H81_13596 [Grifola frondosa]|uniref:Uncharacterized protein n=1 Tax=Grifola frondosa TaxID=5627 RepID=A0A1C7LNX9_GRIFR|nr:hypothetical protein A0H81_13596 [Grifola frondosa]